jgi:hypothetical protein
MLTTLLAAGLASQPLPPVMIIAQRDGQSCSLAVDGRQLAWPADEYRLLADFRRYRRQGRTALFRMEPDTPYRCIGVVVYIAQRARLDMSMGFLGNGPER